MLEWPGSDAWPTNICEKCNYLLQYNSSGYLVQVLQVRMEQVCVCQGYLQQHFNDIANSTVIWQSDLLGSADEIPQTGYRGFLKHSLI